MNNVGFKGFTKPAPVSAELVKEKLGRLSVDGLFVYWSGNAYRIRRGSGRSGALTLITEKRRPISLKVLIERAAQATPNGGYTPDFVRSGLFLHGGSKPAVFFAVTKDADGNLVAARDYPYPDEEVSKKPIKAGDIVVKATKDVKKPKAVKGQSEPVAAITDQTQS
jgi:hypothetical protein